MLNDGIQTSHTGDEAGLITCWALQLITKLETHMHSLEANASPAGRFFAAKSRRRCHIPVASQDIGGAVYPQILT